MFAPLLAVAAALVALAPRAYAEAAPVVIAAGVNRSFDAALAPLSYAETDAERFALAMTSVGGAEARDVTLLRSPTADEFVRAVAVQARGIAADAKDGRSRRLVLYFSGHADDRGLHFRGGPLSRAKLHDLLSESGVATKIVFIDSCFAGSIAAKGVESAPPFDVPKLDMDELTGTVFLTASSAREVAYESEQLSGSVFTHHILSGLNGAADSNGDGLVTVDELYQYVYRETRLRSIAYPGAGPQRPEYHANLKGQGALVLSQPRRGMGTLRVDSGIFGRVHLASTSGLGSFTVEGDLAKAREYRLPEGAYRALIRRGDEVGEASVLIARHEPAELRAGQFAWRTADMAAVSGTKGAGALAATTSVTMVTARQALADSEIGAYQVEMGHELAGMATPHSRLSVLVQGGLYKSYGLLDDRSYEGTGLSFTLGAVISRTNGAMRLLVGATQSREWQDWYLDGETDAREVWIPASYVGVLLPVGTGSSGHWSVVAKREVVWLQTAYDTRAIAHYVLGIAVEPLSGR